MREPSFSSVALDAKARAACALLDGGLLMLFDGERPGSPTGAASEGHLLAVLKFSTPAFGLPEAGRCVSRRVLPGPGLRGGRPTWFRCVTKLGEPVVDGNCGPLVPDASYDLYVERDVEQDGEVRLGEFVYQERER